MKLSEYHKRYTTYSNEEMVRRALVKEKELERVFSETAYRATRAPVKIAVLGCGDRRLVRLHRELFERLLGKRVQVTTFDVTIDHLLGETGVVCHDATKPLPGAPYDIVISHVLLPFIDPSKQWDVLWNAHEALRDQGIAIHVVGMEEKSLDIWKKKFEEKGVRVEVLDLVIHGILRNPLRSRALITRK